MDRVKSSRLLNVLFRGHPEGMLCARIYHMHNKHRGQWTFYKTLVDYAFERTTGETQHCRRSYLWQHKEKKDARK